MAANTWPTRSQNDRKPSQSYWRKAVILPLWAIEITWLFIVMVIIAWELHIQLKDETEFIADWKLRLLDHLYFTLGGTIWLPLIATSLVLDVAAIILYYFNNLKPAIYLAFACVNTCIWAFVFLINAIFAKVIIEGVALAVTSSCILFLTSVGQLAYGAVLVHRKRTGKLDHPLDGKLDSYAREEAGTHLELHQYETHGVERSGSTQTVSPTSSTRTVSPTAGPSTARTTLNEEEALPAYSAGPSGDAASLADTKAGYYSGESAAQSYEEQGVGLRGHV